VEFNTKQFVSALISYGVSNLLFYVYITVIVNLHVWIEMMLSFVSYLNPIKLYPEQAEFICFAYTYFVYNHCM